MSIRRLIWMAALVLAVFPAAARADAERPAHVPATAQGEDLQEYVEGAARLEGRIIAPCCWNQTIDIHGSEPSYELRREIRRRLKAGESADAIEASLIQRYGQRILAVPDSSPLIGMATLLVLVFGGAGLAAYFMLKRWTRAGARPKQEKAPGGGEPKRDALDDRLDRELAEIRDQA